MSEEVLLVEDRGPIRVICLNRPRKLNALNSDLIRALHDALEAADDNNSVRALVLSGAGRAFCSGADLAEAPETSDNLLMLGARGTLAVRTLVLMHQLNKPIISVVQGAAAGAGAALAIGCDMMIAAHDLKFGYPEVHHGMIPGIVMPSLQRQLGAKLAFELISTDRWLTAKEALDYGLANRIAPADEVLAIGIEIAMQWSKEDPLALSASKALFYRVADLRFDEATRTGRDVSTIVRGFRSTRR